MSKSNISYIDKVLERDLDALSQAGLFREIRNTQRTSAVRAKMNGTPLLLFCGNDYLGLSQHSRVVRAFQNAAERCGTGAGAARLISGSSPEHTRLEKKLAAWKRKEAALLFSSGYLANVGVISALAGKEDIIVMDKLCHASIIDGARLSQATIRVFPHKNYVRCEDLLKRGKNFRRRLLVSETVFSMDGDIADTGELVRLKEKYAAVLILDDAHGTGVMGAEGRGVVDGTGLEGRVDVIVGTLSKALGGLGGFAAGSQTMVSYLTNRARTFIFATALPPAVCAAAYEAVMMAEKNRALRQKLFSNMRHLQEGLSRFWKRPITVETPIIPLIYGDAQAAVKAARQLYKKGILIPAIRPPTVPKGTARLRLTLSAAHSVEDIDQLLRAIKALGND